MEYLFKLRHFVSIKICLFIKKWPLLKWLIWFSGVNLSEFKEHVNQQKLLSNYSKGPTKINVHGLINNIEWNES